MIPAHWNRPTDFPIAEGKRRIRIDVSYDGSLFSGWQRQHNVRTVQHEIEKALYKILKEEVVVFGSGRTDAGVHALGQVAHFDTVNHSVPIEAFALALNQLLSHDVRITKSSLVDDSFHARFTSLSREYRYYTKEIKEYTPFDCNRVCRVRCFPSLELLNAYAEYIEGIHDFTTFSSAADQSRSRLRDVFVSRFFFEDSFNGSKVLVYQVAANAFLMHQVRSMVGTMLQLGEKGVAKEEFKRRLDAKNRFEAGRTAPADGLYLYRIDYES